MLRPKLAQTMLRVTPPQDGSDGFAQEGKVIEITDTEIVLNVLVDGYRQMRFNRITGMDTTGLGSFIVHSPIA